MLGQGAKEAADPAAHDGDEAEGRTTMMAWCNAARRGGSGGGRDPDLPPRVVQLSTAEPWPWRSTFIGHGDCLGLGQGRGSTI